MTQSNRIKQLEAERKAPRRENAKLRQHVFPYAEDVFPTRETERLVHTYYSIDTDGTCTIAPDN
ncbi:hypothetical protein HYFRA_00008998 [Hymenoscyphus fraxineus]|uniref:Uncharacterized protein n=1 Tax=Hymenoscyphus fraxineus TaxID=746836 RepID=A0A9N9KRU8_9HELO|nr:hypothetical protein HYFRA_00008998 [Hymenoscyphus fraxineus]